MLPRLVLLVALTAGVLRAPVFNAGFRRAHAEFALTFNYWCWLLDRSERKGVVDMEERKVWKKTRGLWRKLEKESDRAIQ